MTPITSHLVRVFLALACCVTIAWSQPADTTSEVGVFGGGSLALHSGSFTQLGSYVSCCPEFTSATGVNPYGGVFFTVPLTPRWRVQLRLAYAQESGSFLSNESVAVADLRDTARVIEAVMTHELRARLSSLGIEPMMALRVAKGFDLMAGMRLAAVLSSSFTQTETLTKPEDYGAYLGAGRTWVNHEGTIPDAASVRTTAVLGVRTQVPLNTRGTLFMAPEAFLHLPLNRVASPTPWTVTEIRLGVSIGMHLERQQQPPVVPPPPPPAPPVVVPEPVVRLQIMQRVDNRSDDMIDVDTIRVLQSSVLELIPVLGHVYFDEGSATIPERYAAYEQRTPSSLSSLNDVVYGMLGIVADRTKRSSATITLTGSTSGTMADDGLSLARRRAESARDALLRLGVPASQIRVVSRRIPRVPTSASNADEITFAEQENRRVEISSSDRSVLAPFELRRVDERMEPEEFTITTSVDAPAGVRAATVTVGAGDRLRTYQNGTGTFNETVTSMRSVDRSSTELITTLTVKDSVDRIVRSERRIPVRASSSTAMAAEREEYRITERYRLILFPFNDHRLTSDHDDILTIIRSRIDEKVDVRVIGSTDTMGASEHNAKLSQQRALSVGTALGIDPAKVEGVGASKPLLSNALPEGRAYNRTVVIELRRSSLPIR